MDVTCVFTNFTGKINNRMIKWNHVCRWCFCDPVLFLIYERTSMSRPYSSEKNHFDLVQIFSIPISSLFYLRRVNTVFSLSLQAYGIFNEFGVIKLGKACFLVATERLHKSACPSVRPLFQQSVTLLVFCFLAF